LRMTFHQRRNRTVLGAANEVAFPMSGDGAILDLCGPFSNGNGVADLTTAVSAIPPRCANINRMDTWSLPRARPISCNECPAFQRLHISVR
jgi:hypothetical protein